MCSLTLISVDVWEMDSPCAAVVIGPSVGVHAAYVAEALITKNVNPVLPALPIQGMRWSLLAHDTRVWSDPVRRWRTG